MEQKQITIGYKGLLSGTHIPKIKTNFWAKISLKFKGYCDGKKSIPYQNSNKSEWISPTIQDEKAKINSFMSGLYRNVNYQNENTFNAIKVAIAKFEENVSEIKNLHSFLASKFSTYEISENATLSKSEFTPEQINYLNSRRASERGLDDIPVRIRRMNEYFEPLLPLRDKLEDALANLEGNYEEILENYTKIELSDEAIKGVFFDVNARVDKRLSWYWQGVLCKHKDRKTIKFDNQKIDDFDVRNLYDSHRKNLETHINDIKNTRTRILELQIV